MLLCNTNLERKENTQTTLEGKTSQKSRQRNKIFLLQMYMDITKLIVRGKKTLMQEFPKFSKFPLCTLHKILKDHK